VGNALTVVQVAYEHFNRELFAGELPPCLITLQRSKRCRAYYSPDRFARGDNPVGRSNSPILGHFKFPHLAERLAA
jgi:hypothetical protein